MDKFLLVPRRISSHNLQRLLSFYHRPSATTQYGFNTRCLILVFRIWIIDSCHCPPIHERFNIIFAIEDPLGSIQRLPCRNPLEEIVTFPPVVTWITVLDTVPGLRCLILFPSLPSTTTFTKTCHRCNFFDIPCIRMLFNLIAALKINFNARLHRITCSLAAPCCTNFSSVCARAHTLHGHREPPTL